VGVTGLAFDCGGVGTVPVSGEDRCAIGVAGLSGVAIRFRLVHSPANEVLPGGSAFIGVPAPLFNGAAGRFTGMPTPVELTGFCGVLRGALAMEPSEDADALSPPPDTISGSDLLDASRWGGGPGGGGGFGLERVPDSERGKLEDDALLANGAA